MKYFPTVLFGHSRNVQTAQSLVISLSLNIRKLSARSRISPQKLVTYALSRVSGYCTDATMIIGRVESFGARRVPLIFSSISRLLERSSKQNCRSTEIRYRASSIRVRVYFDRFRKKRSEGKVRRAEYRLFVAKKFGRYGESHRTTTRNGSSCVRRLKNKRWVFDRDARGLEDLENK